MSFWRREGGALLLLTALTLAAYFPVFFNGFVNFDDDRTVTQNVTVRQGLTCDGIVYAFTTFETGNWIPLTWLSLELDATLFGIAPAGFHTTNLLLHLCNVWLIFAILVGFNLARARSLVVAALFAVHPLHVESVAWVSERKDVLSTCLMLLTIWQYQRYLKNPSWRHYSGVLALFVLGLMAKPMLVTLPILLLLLDFWPLRRLHSITPELPRRMLEKLPLLTVSAVFSVIAILAQQSDRTFVSIDHFSLVDRLINSMNSLLWYLSKTFVPTSLSVFYPLSLGNQDWASAVLAAACIMTLTGWAIWNIWRRPYLIVGWLWFVISLLPVIGLVQVGAQAHADRYSYVPHIGLLLMVVLLACEGLNTLFRTRIPHLLSTAGAVLALGTLCVQQASTWRDAQSLWTQALRCDSQNWMAYFQLGREALLQGDLDNAQVYAARAIEIQPQAPTPFALLGRVHQRRNQWPLAEEAYRKCLQLDPENREGLIGMAAVAYSTGQVQFAIDLLQKRLTTHPRDIYPRKQLGLIHMHLQDWEAAHKQFGIIQTLDPMDAENHRQSGWALLRLGHLEEALACLQQAVHLDNEDGQAHAALARLYTDLGNSEAALHHAQAADRARRKAGNGPIQLISY